MPFIELSVTELEVLTQEFVYIWEVDPEVHIGEEDPIPTDTSHRVPFGWKLKHDIIKEFWEEDLDEYLYSIRIYNERKIVVYDYIRIKKSINWSNKEKVVEILYHEFIEQRFPETIGELFPHLDIKPRISRFSRALTPNWNVT